MAGTYSPLARDEFRILELHPGHETDRLESRLIISTAQGQPYEAVSYCWGHDLTRETILVGGEEMQITTSLASAMRRMRHSDRVRHLWIDQICINQNDEKEKSIQVGEMMGQIYEETSTLIIWLGEADNDSRVAIKLANHLSLGVKSVPKPGDAPVADLSKGNLRDASGVVNLRPWRSVCKFLSRPWFRRIWMAQEVCLPKTDQLSVYCGTEVVPWWKVTLLHNSIMRYQWFLHIHEAPLEYKSFLLELHQLEVPLEMRRAMFKASQKQQPVPSANGITLLENLWLLIGREVTDERDRIFAMKYISNCPGPTDLQVDYSLTLAHVATETTRKIILHQNDLMVLGLCQLTRNYPEFPSWVPDWTVKRQYRPTRILSLGTRGHAAASYSALPRMDPMILASSTENKLVLKGYRIQTVAKVSMDRGKETLRMKNDQIYMGLDPGDFPSHTIMWDIIRVAGRDNVRIGGTLPSDATLDPSWPRSDPKRIHYDKLIAEAITMGKQTDASVAKLQDKARTELDALISKAWELSRKTRTHRMVTLDAVIAAALVLLPPEFSQYPEDPKLWDTLVVERLQRAQSTRSTNPGHDADLWFNAFRQTIIGHKFFVTEEDDFGIGPYEVKPGDSVVLLPGAVVPFVLRRCTSSDWTLVGECYCYSYMDGKRGAEVVATREPEVFPIV